MWKQIAPALLLAALAACGSNGQPVNQANGEGQMENTTLTNFGLSSNAFADGDPIPTEYTCDGADQSPPLSWSDPPTGTRGFAIIMFDPDAPGQTFNHWGVWNIPGEARELAAGAGNQTGGPFGQAQNDFGKKGYGGPCPPKGHGMHHYHFRIFALETETLSLPDDANVANVESEAMKHLIDRTELIGTYERK